MFAWQRDWPSGTLASVPPVISLFSGLFGVRRQSGTTVADQGD
jgi:hypothetical protein